MSTPKRLQRSGMMFLSALAALGALLLISALALATPAKPSSTIIVNPGESIQAAINAANPGDTIVINPGTYTESLTLNKAVSLTGVNSATVIIKALPNQRMLTVAGNAVNNSVVISGFTVANGRVMGGVTWDSCPAGCGGGVLITGTVQPIMQNLIITGNSASAKGGGLYANGSLSLNGVAFFSNTVQFGGGGAYIKGAAIVNNSHLENNSCIGINEGCFGGGLMAEQTLEMNNSTFLSNTVAGGTPGGNGGGAYVGTAATITSSLFENNRCLNNFCEGGGLSVFGELRAKDTAFINNHAAYLGGGVSATDSVLTRDWFEANQCTSQTTGCFGGGLISENVTATDTIFLGNSTSFSSGGIYATNATIIGGRFENNRSPSDLGGGLRADQVAVTGTYFLNNVAQYGGGLDVDHSGRIVNAVFTGNSDSGYAAAIRAEVGELEILHTTIASSTLADGPAIGVLGVGTANITDTIIVSFTVGIMQHSGSVVYEDYNLFFRNTTNLSGTISGGTHDVFGNPNFVDPALDNYHIISPSAAIDAGVNAGVTTDLDGIPRPVGAGYDIGAYEYINFTAHVYLPLVRK